MDGHDPERYVYSDLAIESRGARDGPGIEFDERDEDGFAVTSMRVTNERGEAASGRPRGNYVTVAVGRPWLMGAHELARARATVARELRAVCRAVCDPESVLVVGLGNRAMTADALGPTVVDGLIVTRHVKSEDESVFRSLSRCEVSALAPGVLGQTGIETLELVRGAAERVRPSLIIAVDALAARGVERLAATVQISDAGIAPGSGIGNTRRALDRESLGVPVVAVGAPTVVNSATLVRDALELAGIDKVSPELESVLENGRSFFVSLKESDVAVAELAALISGAINSAFTK